VRPPCRVPPGRQIENVRRYGKVTRTPFLHLPAYSIVSREGIKLGLTTRLNGKRASDIPIYILRIIHV
jgi:hypothetical protein